MDITILLPGVPLKGSRGYLGWSTVALITPKEGGPILFDTGSYGDRALLMARIRELLPPGREVGTVVLSHLHFDHAQNVDLFPGARIVISRREWNYVTSGEYKEAGDTFVPAPLVAYLKGLEDRVSLTEDGDTLAPGISCVMLPGHTPGSMGLRLEETDTLITGDAVKNGREFLHKNPGYHFDSRERWLASRDLAASASRIIPGHDVPYYLKSGKITGFDPAPAVTLAYAPFRPSLDTLVIRRDEGMGDQETGDEDAVGPSEMHGGTDAARGEGRGGEMGSVKGSGRTFAGLDLLEIEGKRPHIAPGAYVDPQATLVGDVLVEEGVGIWPGAVIRGDEGPVVLKAGAMVLENTVVEAAKGLEVTVGPRAIISHGAIVHGARVGSGAVVGIGAIVLEEAVVGADVIVGSGALVPPGKVLEEAVLVLGMPARVKRKLGEEEFRQKAHEWGLLAQKLDKYIKARGR